MHKKLSLLLFFSFTQNLAFTQILPKEGSVLNYRMAGFSFPLKSRTADYKIEIATGYYNSKDSFKKYITLSSEGKDSMIIVELPSFGQQYTWRSTIFSGKNNAKLTQSKLHHFSTGMSPNVDSTKIRFRITHPAETYKDAYIFLDGNKALYDMEGHPVWYLPNIGGLVEKEGAEVHDLKLTPQGTITFLLNDQQAYEINYDGKILWRGPRNEIVDPAIHYHHQLTRLGNGHYMTFATSPVVLRHNVSSDIDSGFLIVTDQSQMRDSIHTVYESLPISSLVEYDANGNIAWSWSTAKYMAASDVYFRKPPPHKKKYDIHPNSFFFDEKDSVIYLGFRDISRIIKIKYPDGNLVASYGDTYGPGKGELNPGLFYGQHSIGKSDLGDLYIYNNGTNNFNDVNTNGRHTTSTVERLKEPMNPNDTLQKTWEYECSIEDFANAKHRVFGYTIGGSAVELPDHSMLVSMSSEYNKIFIVDMDKKILFSGLAEKFQQDRKAWEIFSQYHANFMGRVGLECLIRNTN